jgi:hypothetical protein
VLDVDLREPPEDGRVPAPQAEPVSRSRYVAWLAWRRLRRRDGVALVAVLGLAVGAAALACLLIGVAVATDRAVSNEVERIPAEARSARTVWFGVPADAAESYAALDRAVSEAMPPLPLDGPTRLVLVRESTVAGRFVGLAAVDGLAAHVRLRSGRLPRACTPGRCEVLRLRGTGRIPDAAGLRLVEVGTGTLRSRQLFGDFLEATDNATADAEVAPAVSRSARYHRPAPAPLVVAEGVAALAGSPVLDRTYRSYAWVWPLSRGEPRRWQLDDLLGRADRGRAALGARSPSFAVLLPEQELAAARHRSEVAARRLLLVGGQAAALLLAFAALAARGMRRDLQGARRRLLWHGARRGQVRLFVAVESALVALGGVLLGWTVGVAAGSALVAIAGEPVGGVLGHSIGAPLGIAAAAAAVVVTTGLVAAAVAVPDRPRGVGPGDLAAAVAVVLAAGLLLGGAADRERLATSDAAGLALLVLPGAIALAVAIASARALPPLARAVAWHGGLATRLAAGGLGRAPGASVAALAFLTLAFALALMAEGYRSTLTRGEREQAAFRVPLDVTVQEDLRQLVRVLDAAPLERYRELAGQGGAAYPVVRLRGSVGGAEAVGGVTALGLDRGAVERLRVWRDEWAGGSRDHVAALLDPGRDVGLHAPPVPGGRITLRAGPSLLAFAALVRLPDGRVRRIDLGDSNSARATVLGAAVPPGARLAALELVPPRLIERGSDGGTALRGTVELAGPLGRAARGWVAEGGVTLSPTPRGVRLRYTLTPQRIARLRPRQPTDGRPPAVLATAELAELAGGVGRLLPLQVGGATVPVRVVGSLQRFPGVDGDAVIADRVTLQTAVEAVAPGTARTDEIWLDVPSARRGTVEAALARAPYAALSASSRTALERDAAADPVARGTLWALTAAALVALVLAAVGLTLAVRADLRDDGGELFELEASGAAPPLLRRIVRSRAAVVSVAGLVAGGVAGVVLIALVTRLVTVTARAGAAEPPLRVGLDPRVVVAGVLAYALLTAVLVGGATRRAFADPRGPGREDGR